MERRCTFQSFLTLFMWLKKNLKLDFQDLYRTSAHFAIVGREREKCYGRGGGGSVWNEIKSEKQHKNAEIKKKK